METQFSGRILAQHAEGPGFSAKQAKGGKKTKNKNLEDTESSHQYIRLAQQTSFPCPHKVCAWLCFVCLSHPSIVT